MLDNSLNIGGATIPHQTISEKKKNDKWLKLNSDFFYSQATKQIRKNSVFSDIRKMTRGEYTYRAVDIESTLIGTAHEKDLKRLSSDVGISTHLKHFDFLGIITNAITSVFSEMDDLYRFEATDEYTTNEFIRTKTAKYEKYLAATFEAEIAKMLLDNGLNPEKEDFQSEEEQQQYMQTIQAEVDKYTPEQIEKDMAKNFKVAAVDWANNTINADKKKFTLDREDKVAMIDYILTGRWFRHYKMGYDYYAPEYWNPEEVFFSQKVDTLYPQDCEYLGRLTEMSLSDVIVNYGSIMTSKQQKDIGNYWGEYEESAVFGGVEDDTRYLVPFDNYFDHLTNLKMEDAFGMPMAQTMDDEGKVVRHWMPRSDAGVGSTNLKHRRTDIDVDNHTVEVMEVYWRSMKKIGVVIYSDEFEQLAIKQTTEELLSDFLKENEIKVKGNLTLDQLQTALREGTIDEHLGTITYHFIPEIRHMVVVKSKSSLNAKDDFIFDGKPLIQQIKGDSNLYHVRIPVGGIISNSPITKAFPFQQLHNVCLNQVTELLADEPGTFYTFDINTLPDQFKGETTEESLFSALDSIKLNKMLPLDLTRANLEGSTTYPNIFQKNELVFRDQVLYRRDMAEYFKAQGLQQVGITPQMLGTPTKYETAEGISQQANASTAMMSNIIDEFNTSKAKANELHIAIAQQCEVNGKSSARLFKNSDGANAFIDILAEDPEYFPFRKINIYPASNSKDRVAIKMIQQMIMSDNTLDKEIYDVVELFTNPFLIEMKQVAKDMQRRSDGKVKQQQEFQASESDKLIKAQQDEREDKQAHEVELANIRGEWQLKSQYVVALGRDSASTKEDNFDDLAKAYKMVQQENNDNANIELKGREINRKEKMDSKTFELEKQKMILKAREIATREKIAETNKTIAVVNKN